MSEWFATWFDSEYYHELYQHRTTEEAENFIRQLVRANLLPIEGTCVDLACGKGRFSVSLNDYVQKVVGFDLSKNNIDFANKLGLSNANFETLDMRQPFHLKDLDIVFNMFTSFGYFDHEPSNQQVIQNVYDSLKKGGIFVFDYLNCFGIEANLISTETQVKQTATYKIQRYIENGFIKKKIQILPKNNSQTQNITEQIRYYLSATLREMLEKVGFEIVHHWGDYQLSPFEEKKSTRSIFYARKNSHS